MEKAIYLLLQRVFQDFTSAQHIFLQNRVEYPLCGNWAWFSLIDKFQQRSDEDRNRREQRTMSQETQELEDGESRTTRDATYGSQTVPMTSDVRPPPASMTINARGLQLERLTPIHFIRTSMSPDHLLTRHSWCDTAYHAHVSKILLSR
jgi:hypothetical protein